MTSLTKFIDSNIPNITGLIIYCHAISTSHINPDSAISMALFNRFNIFVNKPITKTTLVAMNIITLTKIVPMFITNIIYQALLEAVASELAARMTAMSAATNNADEMIRLLTIDYNKARQAAITQEITEVVSGADALKN